MMRRTTASFSLSPEALQMVAALAEHGYGDNRSRALEEIIHAEHDRVFGGEERGRSELIRANAALARVNELVNDLNATIAGWRA